MLEISEARPLASSLEFNDPIRLMRSASKDRGKSARFVNKSYVNAPIAY